MFQPDASKDYYAVLGVTSDANDGALRKALRDFGKTLHPDKKPEDAEKFKAITQAYHVLIDAQ